MQTFRATPSQSRFLRSRARFVFFVGGLGSGKTAVGAVKALMKIQEGKSGLIVSPDYPHFSKSTWPEWSRWCPWHRVVEHHKTEKRMVFDTGAVVWYGGIDDPDAWRGPNVNWFWFDEGARKRDRKAFDVLCGRIRIGRDPQGWVTTTPRGKHHWLYRVAVKQEFSAELRKAFEEAGAGPLVEMVQSSTRENAANLDPLYLASLEAMYSGKYAEQELGGKFVSFEGLVYEEFGEDNITERADYRPERGPIELAYDDGYTNPRVILFIQRGDDGSVYVFDEMYHVKHLGQTCVSEALELVKRYAGPDARPEIAVGDPSAAELREAFRRADVVARGAKCEVVEGIKVVRRMVRDGTGRVWLRIHPRCRNLIEEMESYCYPDPESNRDVEKPLKQHDHGPDALRYWAWLRWRRVWG